MSSLLRDYAGRTTLTYIDPPFDTGADVRRLYDGIAPGKLGYMPKETSWLSHSPRKRFACEIRAV
jgi:hypothetical protein